MTKLSVNINKIATLRNARGGNVPDLIKATMDCERFGAQGITVHPRPDQRHIRYDDVHALKEAVKTEFNIEGFPSQGFMDLVMEVKPTQVTLVPDPPGVITSNAGWDTISNKTFLKDVITDLKKEGMRVSIFIDPNLRMIEHAKDTGTDRIELYTEDFARNFPLDKQQAITPYMDAARKAVSLDLGINAGHDLNLDNLHFFFKNIPGLLEVSIGHAIISDALYLGLENTIQMYLRRLK